MKNQTISSYQEKIIAICKCSKEEAIIIEDYMRGVYFQSTLDCISLAQFNKGAKESFSDIQIMNNLIN